MQEEVYVIFTRYWNDIVLIGVLPILALTYFNQRIWCKIRSSRRFRRLHEKAGRHQQGANGQPITPSATRRFPLIYRAARKPTAAPESAVDTSSLAGNESVRLNRLEKMVGRTSSASNLRTVNAEAAAPMPPSSSSGERSSTPLLMGIVVVFCLCHFFRLFLQLDAVFHPSIMGTEHYDYCRNRGLFASPFSVWILTSCNQISLVVNSSINFVVYVFVGRSFRKTLCGILRRGCCRSSTDEEGANAGQGAGGGSPCLAGEPFTSRAPSYGNLTVVAAGNDIQTVLADPISLVDGGAHAGGGGDGFCSRQTQTEERERRSSRRSGRPVYRRALVGRVRGKKEVPSSANGSTTTGSDFTEPLETR